MEFFPKPFLVLRKDKDAQGGRCEHENRTQRAEPTHSWLPRDSPLSSFSLAHAASAADCTYPKGQQGRGQSD